MIYTNEMLNNLKLLRRRFKDEDIGTLRLTDSNLVDTVINFARQSKVTITKDLAYALLKQADVSVPRTELDAKVTQSPSKMPKTYRGHSIRGHEDLEPTSVEEQTRKKALRIYRGQAVA